MGRLADAVAAVPRGPGNRCTVGLVRERLEPTDLADLDAALGDDMVQSLAISAGLEVLGLDVSPFTIGRHRRGACRCARTA